MIRASGGGDEAWPDLDMPGWSETVDSLKLWSQMVGKTRLAHCPMTNHFWQVTLFVTARGLTTSPIPVGGRVIDIELDFVDHRLVARSSDGRVESMALEERPLAGFFHEYAGVLERLGVELSIYPWSVELPERIRLDQDTRLCRYDPVWANRYFHALVEADRLLKQFRGGFLGKMSPVHFFWGGFDLAATRFSGREAPPHPGGVPNVGDWVMRESYSHELTSAGFWPGDARFPEAAFYAYAYPEPPGFASAPIRPAAAAYNPALCEFILPYRALRSSANPSADVLDFLEASYEAAAELGRWDRAALERRYDLVGAGLSGQPSLDLI